MMFHRSQAPVVIQSRDEEAALGPDWARTVWPAGEVPPAEPVPPPVPQEDPVEKDFQEPFWPRPEPAPAPAPDAFEPEPKKRPATKKTAAKTKAKSGRAGGSHARTSKDRHANG